ncbi:chaperone modulator CbpM [Jannaschia pohangensis]|uniref:Chaperone modulatory protein CbpM n=1 Tax=Jannaschia pohangensis TaxID=390807 RepID=A0A1I3HA71_9RHOB|nr:chaperone modulator CbpM [Jannaschia pohangensis]SFI32614.1 chaperone modulatory protein CbpM [Jannaschia pohangensis]
MSERFSEDEVVVTVTRLTRSQLIRFIESDFVKPERGAGGYSFRRVDIARLELLCDLSLDLDLDETALGIVLSLIDQLHAARQDLATMAHAIQTLPPDLRDRVLAAMRPDG